MNHVTELLKSLGVDEQRILQERFGGKKDERSVSADAQPRGLAEFEQSNTTVAFFEGQSLLEVAEKYGINIPSSCRQGQCGTCATRLLSGEVQMDHEDGLDPALKAQGYVLTCVARAKGDVRLDA
jgi:ferredoxin